LAFTLTGQVTPVDCMDHPAHRPRFFLNHLTTMLAVVLLGTALGGWAFNDARHRERDRDEAELVRRINMRHLLTNMMVSRYEDALYGLASLFRLERNVTPEEFARTAQRFQERWPGVQALEWVPFVTADQREAWETVLRQNYPGHKFEITERDSRGQLSRAGQRPSYLPVSYIEPFAGNEPALGYDLLTGPTRADLDRARTGGKPALTCQVRLVQDKLGVIMAVPVLGSLPAGPPKAPPKFLGFVQAVFRTSDLLEQTRAVHPDSIVDMFFIDASEQDPARRILYYRPADNAAPHDSAPSEAEFRRDAIRDLPVPIGGRDWHVLYRPRAGWLAEQATVLPWIRFAGVLAITALLALFINTLWQRTNRIEQIVQERTRQLRASEARFQDILDHSPALIFLKDLEGRYLLCNQPFADLCQRPQGDILGKRDAELFPAAHARLYRENDAKVMAAGRPMEFEESAVTSAGPRTSIVHKFPLLDEQGRTYALCGIASDITDRKAAEEQKLLLERQLLESQKLESLGVLAGGIAHDFNNILTAILGNASLAGMELPEGHKVRHQLRQIEHASRRAADLCAQMLAYAGKAAFITAPVNLTSLVRDTAALLEVTVGKRARLELQTANGLPSVLGDVTQLRQIVMNLVINASDAIGDRPGGVITVATVCRDLPAEFFQQAVLAPALPAGRYVSLEVRDNGSGMPPEVLARIFEPFFTTKFSGRGLGLAAVLGIIQSHKGALFVESTTGHGTAFRFFLPAGTTEASASSPPFGTTATLVSLRGTVLLVDDEQAVRHVAAHALASIGLKTIEASDGQAALQIYQGQAVSIDLVLLDLMMPGLTGEETLRRLRRINPAVRVIVMSGYSEGETMQRCATLEVTGYLPKPFEIAELVARLRPHLV